MRSLGRLLGISLGLLPLVVGAVALGMAYRPDDAWIPLALDGLRDGLAALTEVDVLGLPRDLPRRLEPLLASPLVRFGAAPLGLLIVVACLLPGRRVAAPSPERPGAPDPFDAPTAADKKAHKKAAKEAAAVARRGMPLEAADICFMSGLYEEAAGYFIEAGEFTRAAEIRHDQNRFTEAAELHLKAGNHDTAGSIFAQQEAFQRSAEAYLAGGNQTVAAEMFEKAGDHKQAADCYAATGFARQAADAYARCNAWLRAATCLEEVILEESTGAGAADVRRQEALRKLVRSCGSFYMRADRYDEAEAVLVKGECFAEAAEVALKCGRKERASELFLKAKDPPRAAEVLREMGEAARAAEVLAEYHRDRGDDADAARHFEEAGEHLAAGDLYRQLEQFERAAACYERQGDYAQAAEMFATDGDHTRAAENFERAGLYTEAAQSYALAGNGQREAELLVRAGAFLRAGRIYHESGQDEEAIKALQQVEAENPDFAEASALLGEIFQGRGMLSLAVAKLSAAVADREIARENVNAFYTLANARESNGETREAVELYEKILAFDYHFPEVEQKLAQARARLEEEEEPVGETAPSTPSGRSGRYKITGKLGRGGMGIVYKASDTVLDRTVAFKVLPAALKENPQALKNFLREAKSAAQLNHPNIVTVYDAGEQDDVYYIAMEYVDGSTLKEIVKRRGKISEAGIISVLAQMCEALAYAHEKKIVHRDIKTANAMWTRDHKAKIMDFGLARVIEEVMNHTTVVSGTPYYMSPEQTLGRNVDHRTDIYSLGVTIFELATAQLPFQEGNLPYHHVHTPAPDPRELNEELSPLIAGIVNRCLQKDPADRYASAREIVTELRAGLNG